MKLRWGRPFPRGAQLTSLMPSAPKSLCLQIGDAELLFCGLSFAFGRANLRRAANASHDLRRLYRSSPRDVSTANRRSKSHPFQVVSLWFASGPQPRRLREHGGLQRHAGATRKYPRIPRCSDPLAEPRFRKGSGAGTPLGSVREPIGQSNIDLAQADEAFHQAGPVRLDGLAGGDELERRRRVDSKSRLQINIPQTGSGDATA